MIAALAMPETGSRLGRRRRWVLDLVRAAGSPLGVQEVADRTGLHPNTARFHLEGLVKAGLATRERRPRVTPGRPSMAYRATGESEQDGPRRYWLLAEMLATLIGGTLPSPGTAAVEAGREWGAYLTEQPPPYRRPNAGAAIERLTGTMATLGFASRAATDGKRYRLCLDQCPFREVAQQHQEVVCSLHLGLMQGALAQMRAAVTVDRLEPLTESGLCVASLTTHEEPGPGTPCAAC